MRSLTAGLLGAAALAAGLLLVRQVKDSANTPRVVPAGENQPATISLERIRALGH
jgi:hypothetical protein